MKSFLKPIAFVFAATSIANCGGKDPEAQVPGQWKDNQGAVIVFNADKTFLQGSGSTSGKWDYKDGKVTISVEKMGGVPIDSYLMANPAAPKAALTPTELATLKQQTSGIVLTLSDDGKTLTPIDPAIVKSRALSKVEGK